MSGGLTDQPNAGSACGRTRGTLNAAERRPPQDAPKAASRLVSFACKSCQLVIDVACRCAERGVALIAAARAFKASPSRVLPIAMDAARVMSATVAADGRDAVAALRAKVAALSGGG